MSDCDPLRYLCTSYGPVEISYVKENDPWCWTVALMSTHDGTATVNHVHGERLEATIQALLDQLRTDGVVTLAEAAGRL